MLRAGVGRARGRRYRRPGGPRHSRASQAAGISYRRNRRDQRKEWAPKADATVRAAGGVYLVRGTNIERIEGAAPKRLLITKWDNIDKLTAWRESEAYMKTLPILDKAVKSVRSCAVEGVN